ncbi:hypothetical protein GUJ93_ZPchr0003g17397 [Zizania palustris]|uniref:Pentatricopeptide repeat-containing protein n=1 Tax=Zizania palustris TaxID=103762 RepID=A0A8J5S2K0_ZIZPA|nr:hypothetical protein GUJ93_ZPchr0003g17397 [Zizania palustris]
MPERLRPTPAMSSSLASSSYRRRIVGLKDVASHAAYWSRLPARARPPDHTRIGAAMLPAATSAHGVESSIITVLAMQRWETLSQMAYKSGKLDKAHGKLALKILCSIVQRSGFDRITHIYCMAVHILVQAQMPLQAMSVFRHLAMTGFSCSSIFSSLLRTISRCDSTNLFAVDLLVNAYVKEGKALGAALAISFMDDCGIKASSYLCNNILNALVEEGELEYVWLFLKQSLDRKFPLDVTTCNIMLNSLCTQGNLKKAEYILQKMKGCCLPNAVTYNTILNWYLKKGRCKAALHILDDMENNGKINLAINIFNQMRKQSLKPSVATYTTLIDGYCQNGRTDEALRVLYEMQTTGVRPSELTYSALLNGEVSKAKQILKSMLVNGTDPDVITYSALINGTFYLILIPTPFFSMGFAKEEIICKEGLYADCIAYNSMMNGYLKGGQINELERLMRNMHENEVHPNTASYNILMHGVGDINGAFMLKEEMEALGIVPSEVAESSIVRGLCRCGKVEEAIIVFSTIMRAGMVPTIATFTTLMHGLCKEFKIADAFHLKKLMESCGLKVDVVTYNVLITGLCNTNCICDALDLYEEMKSKGLRPNITTYITLIGAMYATSTMQEGEKLLKDIEDRGIIPSYKHPENKLNVLCGLQLIQCCSGT